MSISMEFTADTSRLDKLTGELAGKVRDAVLIGGHNIEAGAKEEITAVGAIDTGTTKDSIDVRPEDGGFAARIGPHTHYAIYIEMGTVRMAARPFLMPAYHREIPIFKKAVAAIVEPYQ